ncbi:MAG: hypothetical protein ACOY3J_08320 [Bacillota bacterium]
MAVLVALGTTSAYLYSVAIIWGKLIGPCLQGKVYLWVKSREMSYH